MQTRIATEDVDRLAKDIVSLVDAYLKEDRSGEHVMEAMNGLAAAVAFYLVAIGSRFKNTDDAWDQILARHIYGMQRLFEESQKERDEENSAS